MTTSGDGVTLWAAAKALQSNSDMTGRFWEDLSPEQRGEYLEAAALAELAIMTARAEAAEAALEAMRMEPTAEEVEGLADLPDVQRHFCGGCKARSEHHDAIRSVVAAFLAARGK